MSHQRKLIRSVLITTAAIAIAGSLGGCFPIGSLLHATDATRSETASVVARHEKTLDFSLDGDLDLPEGMRPTLTTTLSNDSEWVVKEEISDDETTYLSSLVAGCGFALFNEGDSGYSTDTGTDFSNTLNLIGSTFGDPTYRESAFSISIRTHLSEAGVDAMGVLVVEEGVQSTIFVNRVFTDSDVMVGVLLSCYDGTSPEEQWNEIVGPSLAVTLTQS